MTPKLCYCILLLFVCMLPARADEMAVGTVASATRVVIKLTVCRGPGCWVRVDIGSPTDPIRASHYNLRDQAWTKFVDGVHGIAAGTSTYSSFGDGYISRHGDAYQVVGHGDTADLNPQQWSEFVRIVDMANLAWFQR